MLGSWILAARVGGVWKPKYVESGNQGRWTGTVATRVGEVESDGESLLML